MEWELPVWIWGWVDHLGLGPELDARASRCQSETLAPASPPRDGGGRLWGPLLANLPFGLWPPDLLPLGPLLSLRVLQVRGPGTSKQGVVGSRMPPG